MTLLDSTTAPSDIGIHKRIMSGGQEIPLHNELGFKGMRAAGRLASQTLDYITPFVVEGVSTEKLNQLCHDFILQHKAIPAPLNYRGFPKSICTSVNHVVCHGIPSATKILKTGDIINIDVTVILDGWFGDTSRMFKIGKTSNLASKLIDVTYDSLMKAIDLVKPGATLGDIGHVIQDYAESQGFSIVREFCGHGLGRVFHDAPEVVHFGTPNTGVVLEEGMFFTIEPMVNAGKPATKTLGDGWTAVTRDKTLSAQFEHSLGVTATGVEIFTKST
jgi:methionyl aminopeptidase